MNTMLTLLFFLATTTVQAKSYFTNGIEVQGDRRGSTFPQRCGNLRPLAKSKVKITSSAEDTKARIYAVGDFNWDQGPRSILKTSYGMLRLFKDGTIDCSWNKDGTGFQVEATVNAVIALPDGKVLVGGIFKTYNGSPVPNLIRLNEDGTLDPSFDLSGLEKNPAWKDETGKSYSPMPRGVADLLLDEKNKRIYVLGRLSEGRSIFVLNFDGSLDLTTKFNTLPRDDDDWFPAGSVVRLDQEGQVWVGKTGLSVYNDSGVPLKTLFRGLSGSCSNEKGMDAASVDITAILPTTDGGVFLVSDRRFRLLDDEGNCSQGFNDLTLKSRKLQSSSSNSEYDILQASSTLELPGGKFLVSGTYDLESYSQNKTLTSDLVILGADGSVQAVSPFEHTFYLRTVMTLENKLMVMGHFRHLKEGEREISAYFARVNLDLSLDTTTHVDRPIRVGGKSMVELPGDKILSTAVFRSFQGDLVTRIVVLNGKGEISKVLSEGLLPNPYAEVTQIIKEGNGRILVFAPPQLIRLKQDLSLDPTFSSAIVRLSSEPHLTLLPQGYLVTASEIRVGNQTFPHWVSLDVNGKLVPESQGTFRPTVVASHPEHGVFFGRSESYSEHSFRLMGFDGKEIWKLDSKCAKLETNESITTDWGVIVFGGGSVENFCPPVFGVTWQGEVRTDLNKTPFSPYKIPYRGFKLKGASGGSEDILAGFEDRSELPGPIAILDEKANLKRYVTFEDLGIPYGDDNYKTFRVLSSLRTSSGWLVFVNLSKESKESHGWQQGMLKLDELGNRDLGYKSPEIWKDI
ncbi:MAG TPA: delta-60 repeat domain-containing protein [Bacteriovoracaceae bacterium]|nr:delta-60 repeat domain-containing protein [Bacteriovoracaceae bacterium]